MGTTAGVVLLLKTEALGAARVVAAKRRRRDVGFIFGGGIGVFEGGRLEMLGCCALWELGCGVCRLGLSVVFILG